MAAIVLVLLSTFLHAGWNLVARSQQDNLVFLRVNLLIAVVGLGPALVGQCWGTPFPAPVWGLLVLSGIFQAGYYYGLARGYQEGQFTSVYPVVRALPILLLACIDLLRGRAPQPLAWLGMVLVAGGCLCVSLPSPRGLRQTRLWDKALVWTLLAALGVVGYSTVDKLAAELIAPGPLTAASYGVFESAAVVLPLWLALRWLSKPTTFENSWASWKWPAVIAAGTFSAYWLVLWAFQLNPQTSYILALRQFSIIIGVVAGSLFLHEPARGMRIASAVIITLGIACIVLAG